MIIRLLAWIGLGALLESSEDKSKPKLSYMGQRRIEAGLSILREELSKPGISEQRKTGIEKDIKRFEDMSK